MTLTQELWSAGAIALISHWAFFRRGEHDRAAANIVRVHLLVCGVVVFQKCRLAELPYRVALQETTLLLVVYTAALFASILLYRLFFSPLHHIKGPLALRLSKLTHVWKQARTQNYDVLHGLRDTYGDVVRTGPSEVTLFGTEAFYQVHGKGSHCTRASYYDLLHPMISLATARDPVLHAYRRKVWEPAFSIRAIERLEPLIYQKADLLVRQLRDQQKNGPVDISTWMEYYTFDLMGEFGLTIKFECLERAGPHPILSLFHMSHRKLGPLSPAPWMRHLLMGIPGVKRLKPYKRFMDWAHDELNRNIREVSTERTDIMRWILDDAKATDGIEANWRYLMGDLVLVMAAGSEPMCQILSNIMYHLIQHPDHLHRLRDELATINVRDYKALQHLTHLTACIYETLRMNPPVASAGLRVSPYEGMTVYGKFIPGGTTIAVPQYSLCRDSRNFKQPDSWIPERFSTQPHLILDKQAFTPWNIGDYQCPGKNLSLMEIRVALALILTELDFEFAPGENGKGLFTESLDYFTTTPGPLHLVFRSRAGES
ncbi:putative cytochrome P450 monooxygenase [Aspergillus steynii IBT 23096]|uniref:Putative cytochrome P450 monooxygenase n=1 Tax=Aspergillus steynii IBT 23096 TaxID=1392250 RepID=A0A2I2GPB1_9EURO|nr:putative cytochrome P450 monooxygenase [Aspergillus steynii IBT 23096]PLB54708.1 putative cytochrome P450 monooxygenase [Aspergillus steynii IBT 23096]